MGDVRDPLGTMSCPQITSIGRGGSLWEVSVALSPGQPIHLPLERHEPGERGDRAICKRGDCWRQPQSPVAVQCHLKYPLPNVAVAGYLLEYHWHCVEWWSALLTSWLLGLLDCQSGLERLAQTSPTPFLPYCFSWRARRAGSRSRHRQKEEHVVADCLHDLHEWEIGNEQTEETCHTSKDEVTGQVVKEFVWNLGKPSVHCPFHGNLQE